MVGRHRYLPPCWTLEAILLIVHQDYRIVVAMRHK